MGDQVNVPARRVEPARQPTQQPVATPRRQVPRHERLGGLPAVQLAVVVGVPCELGQLEPVVASQAPVDEPAQPLRVAAGSFGYGAGAGGDPLGRPLPRPRIGGGQADQPGVGVRGGVVGGQEGGLAA
jgi:hypothetical protein